MSRSCSRHDDNDDVYNKDEGNPTQKKQHQKGSYFCDLKYNCSVSLFLIKNVMPHYGMHHKNSFSPIPCSPHNQLHHDRRETPDSSPPPDFINRTGNNSNNGFIWFGFHDRTCRHLLDREYPWLNNVIKDKNHPLHHILANILVAIFTMLWTVMSFTFLSPRSTHYISNLFLIYTHKITCLHTAFLSHNHYHLLLSIDQVHSCMACRTYQY